MAGRIRQDFSDDALQENHEINVTPFIDVILVLLIIFMVAAPLATVDVNVDLPVSTAKPQPRPDKPIYLSVKQDRSLSLGDEPIGREALQQTLDRLSTGDREQRVFLRADQAVAYGELMEVINLLRHAGYLKIALVGMESMAATPSTQASGSSGGAP